MFRKKIIGIAVAAAMVCSMVSSVNVFAEAGTYYSELTGEAIDSSLQNQRPIAVMVDNESLAYDHFGMAEADVVYELMNSTANGRITRLMAMVKDWEKITQMGSIRSVRPTNILLAAEWNAVLCHDGGPFYVDQYFAKDYAKEHFSGGFTRVNNGKSTEFTEYVTAADLDKKFADSGYSKEYNQYRPESDSHFTFVSEGTELTLSGTYGNAVAANKVVLPFEHTTSTLQYNQETGTYDYYAYNAQHLDGEDQQPLTFENVILQNSTYTKLDENGYLIYNCIDENRDGYYITNGEAIPITWTKAGETQITRYYDMSGNELAINRGKTYISLVPDDIWGSLVIE
ncbi:MAG: DUF3048 domain-containing protein [Eubacteriales bacterium]|nr:DUF3048 domain-containing protein [Eubacteriales bacterium]